MPVVRPFVKLLLKLFDTTTYHILNNPCILITKGWLGSGIAPMFSKQGEVSYECLAMKSVQRSTYTELLCTMSRL